MCYEFYYYSGLSTSYFVDITHIESLAFHENGSIEKIVTKGFVKKCQKLVIYVKLVHDLLYDILPSVFATKAKRVARLLSGGVLMTKVNSDQTLLKNQLRMFFYTLTDFKLGNIFIKV